MKISAKTKIAKIALLSVLSALFISGVSVFGYNAAKVNAAENVEQPQITLIGANVSLKDSVNIVYAAAVKNYDYTKYKTKLLVWKKPQSSYTVDNCDVIIDSSYHADVQNYSCDMFYYGLPAKNIVDQLYVRAYVNIDGKEFYSEANKYSVLEYLYDMLGKNGLTDYQKRMYEAILKYGGRAQDLFDYLRNRRADDVFYSIHVENGTFDDGFTRGLFLENEEVTMTANAAPEGKKFAYWQDLNGIIVGYDKVLTVKATAANVYTAVFVDKITVAEQLNLTAKIAYDDDIDAVDLPDVINVKNDDGEITSSIKITWDKTQFIKSRIGDQVLTAAPQDEESKAILGEKQVTMTVTVMPYTFELDALTGNYHVTKYYGSEAIANIPETYRDKQIDQINSLAFNAALSVNEVYIPDTIEKIEKNAFNACDNIQTMRIPFIGESIRSSVNSYFAYIFGAEKDNIQKSYLPANLNKVILSDQITSIPRYAFYNCVQLTEITLPTKLEYINNESFYNCNISEVTIPESLKYIYTRAFDGCNKITKVNITKLNSFLQCGSDSSFGGNADLYLNGKLVTEVNFPGGIKDLYPIIAGISSIKKVTIPNSVVRMVSNVGTFEDCKNLEEVVFEDGGKVEEIWSSFKNCASLRKVNIPSSVKKFENSPFLGCKNLSVYYGGTIADWCNIEDFAAGILRDVEKLYYKKDDGYEELINLVIPETVTMIDDYTFRGYKNLKSVTFHDGITAIGENAFCGCTNLTSAIELPSQLKYLGAHAFESTRITSVVIPQYVTEIYSDAFYGCGKLTSVTLPAGIKKIGFGAFHYAAITSIVIPKSVTYISSFAFDYAKLTNVTFEDPNGWTAGSTALSADDLQNTETAAEYLRSTYSRYDWSKQSVN